MSGLLWFELGLGVASLAFLARGPGRRSRVGVALVPLAIGLGVAWFILESFFSMAGIAEPIAGSLWGAFGTWAPAFVPPGLLVLGAVLVLASRRAAPVGVVLVGLGALASTGCAAVIARDAVREAPPDWELLGLLALVLVPVDVAAWRLWRGWSAGWPSQAA